MTPSPELVLAELKALRLATNLYAQARQNGQTDKIMLELEKKMLTARKRLRDLLDIISQTIPMAKCPDDRLAQLLMVAKRVNWSYKQLMLYRALEKLIDELMSENSGGERSALWAKLLASFPSHPSYIPLSTFDFLKSNLKRTHHLNSNH